MLFVNLASFDSKWVKSVVDEGKGQEAEGFYEGASGGFNPQT